MVDVDGDVVADGEVEEADDEEDSVGDLVAR